MTVAPGPEARDLAAAYQDFRRISAENKGNVISFMKLAIPDTKKNVDSVQVLVSNQALHFGY
jgi:tryptophan synthase alpha subunit